MSSEGSGKLNQGPHADLLSKGDVARLVGMPLRQVTWWVYGLRERKRYTQFVVPRRGGGERVISAPIKPIRVMQDSILRHITPLYAAPPHVHGFTAGRSPLSNAERHEGQEWVLRIDIDNFFPSINFGRVRGMFRAYPFEYPVEVATLLAQIVCYRNELPQGAPTSPIICNLICRGLDKELQRLARIEKCFYTRYADDLTFSTRRRSFPTTLATTEPDGTTIVGDRLRALIEGQGFRVNHGKTRLTHRTQRQRVTGLVVNQRPNIAGPYIRDLRNALYVWEKYGEAAAADRFAACHPGRGAAPGKAPRFGAVIGGRIQYVGSVRGWAHPTYRSLARRLEALDHSFRPRTLRELQTQMDAVLYTEGESDVMHLTAALRHFHAIGEFTNLELETNARAACGGDSQLLAMAQRLEETPQPKPCICVFDRDTPSVLEKAVGPTGARTYRNRVGAIAIVAPPGRSPNDRLCVEMLYGDADLARRDSNGRRVYLLEEFDPRSGHHVTERVHTTQPKSNTLVRDEVFSLDDGSSVALSKMDFARAVLNGTAPFDQVHFDGFRPTLLAIAEMVARVS